MGHWGKFLLLLFTGRSENKFHQQLGANSRYYWVGEEQVPVTVGWTRSKFPDLLSPKHWCHTWHLASTSEYIPSTFPSQLYTTTKLLNNNNNNNNMLDNQTVSSRVNVPLTLLKFYGTVLLYCNFNSSIHFMYSMCRSPISVSFMFIVHDIDSDSSLRQTIQILDMLSIFLILMFFRHQHSTLYVKH